MHMLIQRLQSQKVRTLPYSMSFSACEASAVSIGNFILGIQLARIPLPYLFCSWHVLFDADESYRPVRLFHLESF